LDFFEIVSENTTWAEGQREEILDSGKYMMESKKSDATGDDKIYKIDLISNTCRFA
jgi:hypothetical protein